MDMYIEKQASPASRRIMELLKSKDVEQRQAIADRLAEYSVAVRNKKEELGYTDDPYNAHKKKLPVSRAISDKLKSSPALLDRTIALSHWDARKNNKALHDLRNRYVEAIDFSGDMKNIAEPWRQPHRKDKLNENEIVRALNGRLASYEEGAPKPTEIRERIMRKFKKNRQAKRQLNLLAQFPKEQAGVGEMYFTPHLFEADLDKRKDYMREYRPRRAYVPEYNEDRLYETVLNKQNVIDPSKRLVGGKYYIPAKKGTGVLPATLPNADSGYIYKGGDPKSIRQAKSLKRLSGDENAFFSGLPTVSARYGTNMSRTAARSQGIDPADMPVQPAGYRELRRYLYGDPAKRTEAINSSLAQHSKYFDSIDVRPPQKSFRERMQQVMRPNLEEFGIDKGVENNVTPKVPMAAGLKKITPILRGLKQHGASMVGQAKGFLGGKFGLGKGTA